MNQGDYNLNDSYQETVDLENIISYIMQCSYSK